MEDVGFVPGDPEQAGEHVHAHGPEDLMEIPRRRADSHKGTLGKILVIAGAKNMAGAAYFSALAAYRTGAGLVKIMTVEENRSVIQERLPEAVLSSFDPQWASEDRGSLRSISVPRPAGPTPSSWAPDWDRRSMPGHWWRQF